MKRQTAQEIDEVAADWAAKVDRGLSAEEQSSLDLWLQGDSRRVGAYGRIRAVALQLERISALGPVHSPDAFMHAEGREVSRRRMLTAGGAIAASVAAAGVVGWHLIGRGRLETRRGEVRQLALDDGSVITLNTSTDLALQFGPGDRTVTMAQGEALFDVARDPSRPFVVKVGETKVRVLGTSFLVRALSGQPASVLVRHGVVEVSIADSVAAPRRLTANMRAIGPMPGDGGSAGIAVAEVPEAETLRALAWRDGQIDFEGETLEQAVTELARYSDTRITVDPGLAREQIAGVYQVNNPFEFARSVAGTLRAEVSVTDGNIRIHK